MLNRWYGILMSIAVLAGLLAQVYIPFPDWHLYLTECAVFSCLLIVDAAMRRVRPSTAIANTLAALVLAPLVVPRWYANRPLLPGEFRKYGTDSNFFTAFGIITVFFTGVSAASNFMNFGPDRGFEFIINAGFCVAGVGLILSLATRQDRALEKGATVSAEEVE